MDDGVDDRVQPGDDLFRFDCVRGGGGRYAVFFCRQAGFVCRGRRFCVHRPVFYQHEHLEKAYALVFRLLGAFAAAGFVFGAGD